MSRLIRMDHTGHSTLAEWTAGDETAYAAAVEAFRRELDEGYIGGVSHSPVQATHVRGLPPAAKLRMLRRTVAGGDASQWGPPGSTRHSAIRARHGPPR